LPASAGTGYPEGEGAPPDQRLTNHTCRLEGGAPVTGCCDTLGRGRGFYDMDSRLLTIMKGERRTFWSAAAT